jgi:hypothetical protein
MDSVVVPLLSRRFERAQILQKANHAIPAAALLVTGVQALMEGSWGFGLALGAVQIATSAMLMVTIVRSLRATRGPAHHHHEHGIEWIDIWAAGVLFAEAAERWHVKHHISRPMILTALLTLALGLFHGRIAAVGRRRRAIRITADGMYVGGKPFRAFTAPWRDIASISVTGQVAEVRTRGGRVRRLNLADLRNAEDVRAALAEGRKRLSALEPEASPL